MVRYLFEDEKKRKESLKKWLIKWVDGDFPRAPEFWKTIFTQYKDLLKPSIPNKRVRAYRNEKIGDDQQYNNYTSWSLDRTIADDYNSDHDRQLVWTILHPEDIVAYIPYFGHDVDHMGQEEIIVKPGDYNIEVDHPSRLVEQDKPITVQAFTSEYEQDLKDYIEELKNHTLNKGREWDDEGIRGEIDELIYQTRKNVETMITKIKKLLSSVKEKWSGKSTIIIEPSYDERQFDFSPVESFHIKLKQNNQVADFVAFNFGEKLDDVLDGGDTDFFTSETLESDYFLLVNILRNPNLFSEEKDLVLYTARPKSDAAIYNNATEIPVNIFLTSSFNDVEGIAHDMGERHIYKIKISSKYVQQTLATPKIQHYQTVGYGEKKVPIKNITKII